MMTLFQKKSVVGIEILESSLKLTYVELGRKNEILKLINKNVEGFSIDAPGFIKGTFADIKIKKTTAIIVIPSSLITTKNIEIPSCDPQEIESAVRLQTARYTPYSKEEVIIGHISIDKYQEKYTKVLLVIVHKDVINQGINILNKAGLETEKILFASEAIAYWHHSLFKTEKDPVCIVHIDSKFTDFIIAISGKPAFIRTIPLGRIHLSRIVNLYVKFKEEINNSLETYGKEGVGRLPEKFVLSGALEDLEGLEAFLRKNLTLPIETISYFESLKIPAAFKETGKLVSFLPLIVSSANYDKYEINLMPQEMKIKRLLEEKFKKVVKMGILIMIVSFLIGGIFLTRIYTKGAYLGKLRMKYQGLNEEAKEWTDAMIKIRIIKNCLALRGKSLEVLAELYKVIPQSIHFTNVTFEIKEGVTLKGTSKSMAEIFSFVNALETSSCFKNVKVKHTTTQRRQGEDLADFEASSALE